MIPVVSIIIPNFNHSLFLKERLDSIFGQTFQDFEVILLDDASTDPSQKILKKYASHPKVTCLEINSENSGSPFKQWKKGIGLARGKFLWIAESDDFCSPKFLENVLEFSELSTKEMGLIYTQSLDIDEKGKILLNRIETTSRFVPNIWEKNFEISGRTFVEKYLSRQNVIPNASAVVFKKSLIEKAFLNEEWLDMRLCGDWYFWIQISLKTNVGFLATPINFFRFHAGASRNIDDKEKRKLRISEEAAIRKLLQKKSVQQKEGVRLMYNKWQDQFTLGAITKRSFYSIILRKTDYIPFLIKFIIKKFHARKF